MKQKFMVKARLKGKTWKDEALYFSQADAEEGLEVLKWLDEGLGLEVEYRIEEIIEFPLAIG